MMRLGEAANRWARLGVLAPDGVEWALAVANRDFIIHQYDEINRERTWLTLSVDLPACAGSLQALIDQAETSIESEGYSPRQPEVLSPPRQPRRQSCRPARRGCG